MARWVWRLYRGETGLWEDILRGKYLQDRDVWVASPGPGSHFWKALQKIKLVLRLGAKHNVGNGASTHFWLDWWVGPGKLQDRFPNLFAIAEAQEASVASLWTDTGWAIPFRRELGLTERVEWVNLLREIETLRPAATPNLMTWALEPSGRFTARSLYRKLCDGIPSKAFGAIWRLAIPSRIRIFLWQLKIFGIVEAPPHDVTSYDVHLYLDDFIALEQLSLHFPRTALPTVQMLTLKAIAQLKVCCFICFMPLFKF
jgi:hypothetical protein